MWVCSVTTQTDPEPPGGDSEKLSSHSDPLMIVEGCDQANSSITLDLPDEPLQYVPPKVSAGFH